LVRLDGYRRASGFWLAIIAGAILFFALATANSSGYRYAASDQAFYIPAIRQHLDPALFPRDLALLSSQGRFTPYDKLVAAIARATSLSLPALFFGGYLVTLGLLYAALIIFGRRFYASARTTAALVLAYTLHHRIAKTGANTLEGYFHPRMLVFALGAFALLAVWRTNAPSVHAGSPHAGSLERVRVSPNAGETAFRRHVMLAWVLIAIGALFHPTTALFFAVWVGVALAVNEPKPRRPLLIATGVAAIVGVGLLAFGPLTLKPMDQAWIDALADKDYVFPTQWGFDSWALNLLFPAVILLGFWLRRRAGVARPGESGIVAGCLALVAIFLASWPLLMLHSTFAVQMQLSRVFWMADLLAIVYAVWIAAEAFLPDRARTAHPHPGARPDGGLRSPSTRRAQIVASIVLIATVGRAWYSMRHDHPDRPLVEIGLPDDEWTDVGRWLRDHTPPDAGLIADPGHAWRFGTSLRITAERDVFIEDVKDIAIGMYDRAVAMRNVERRAALRDFVSLTPEQFRALAARYDLRYLVTDQRLPLAEVYHNTRFYVYRSR
jgi:hypothetical protein